MGDLIGKPEAFRTSGGKAARNPMPKKETYFQVGICPHCSDHTHQVFVEGIHEYSEEIPDDSGKRYVYGDVHTLSFFRCDGCHGIVGYRTYYADAVEIEEAEKLDKKWALQRDDCGSDPCFKAPALIYSTRKTERALSHYAPKMIREEYDQALKVKRHDPKSFAMRIRRALEAICSERGAPGKNLDDDLKRLERDGVFPPQVKEIAEVLKLIGNAAAHMKPRKPRNIGDDVEVIDDFFHLIVTYVYEHPARLEEYNRLLQIELPQIVSNDSVN